MDEENRETLVLPTEEDYPTEITQQYVLLERFSGSREAETLLARNRRSGELVTVKCFASGHPLYAQPEPDALRKMNAPPLPMFIGECRNSRMRCVIRQYVEGETLDTYAVHHPVSREEALHIGVALCAQLHALHSAVPPVIHRDVKPQNIVMREDGTPVLIDFGISRILADKDTDTMVVGTQGFAPPEQFGFAQTDARSDIYSLGKVLEWLVSRGGKGPAEKPKPLDRVISRMTEFDPKNRYENVLQVRRALLAAEKGRTGKTAVSVCAAALLLAAVLGAVHLLRAEPSVRFVHPLIEQAVRLSLGLDEHTDVTEHMLEDVRGIYIVADKALPDADAFYSAVGDWYAAGRSPRGELEDLADLERMPNLEQVCVAAQELKDISAVSSLRYLNKVEFKHNNVQDISCLEGMERLTYVGLCGNPVRNLTPLLGCPNLAFLDLCEVRSYDASIIGQLGNFDYLDISNDTQSFRCLGEKTVHSLAMAWTGLTDLNDLSGVSKLEHLEISHTAVRDLSPLREHPGLVEVKMAATLVTDFTPLLDLPVLERVTISADMASYAETLADLPFEIQIE